MTGIPSPSIKKLGGAVAGLLEGHLQLFGIELQEEKSHALQVLVLTGLCLVLTLLVLTGLSAALIVYFWDSHRMMAILGICSFYLCALLVTLGRLVRQLRHNPPPFQATLEELARSRELLP